MLMIHVYSSERERGSYQAKVSPWATDSHHTRDDIHQNSIEDENGEGEPSSYLSYIVPLRLKNMIQNKRAQAHML